MRTLISGIGSAQAVLLGCVVIGCATAATITGHITGADFMTVAGVTLGAGGAVTGAHIGGKVAASSAAAATAPQAGPTGNTAPAGPAVNGATTTAVSAPAATV